MSVRLVTKTQQPANATPTNVFVYFDGTIESDGKEMNDEQKRLCLVAAKKYMLNEKALASVMEANKAFWDTIES